MKKQQSDDDQISRTYSELKSGDWLKNAQQRSQRRKSAWNLLLPLIGFPLWLAFAGVFVALAWFAHAAIHPQYAGHARQFFAGPIGLSGSLMLFPGLIATTAPAMLATNFIVYLIPPARRAMENEDRGYPRAGYAPSQRALAKISAVAVVAGIALALVGALLG